jgi:hypothetical protein
VQGGAQTLSILVLLGYPRGRVRIPGGQCPLAAKWPGPPPPGVALQVLGRVQPYTKNPTTQVAHVGEIIQVAPALQERFLHRILGIFVIAQKKKERAG